MTISLHQWRTACIIDNPLSFRDPSARKNKESPMPAVVSFILFLIRPRFVNFAWCLAGLLFIITTSVTEEGQQTANNIATILAKLRRFWHTLLPCLFVALSEPPA
jgi:hypothetical protein